MADQYDPNQLTPMQVPGNDWSSMASAILPGIIGLIAGRGNPLAGIAGAAGGAEGILSDRDKSIQYNNQLEFRKREDARQAAELANQQKRMQLLQNADVRAGDAAAREKESHEIAFKDATLAYTEKVKTAAGRDDIANSLKDPLQKALFRENPTKYGDFMLDNVKRKDVVERYAPILSQLVKLPPGADASKIADAFGDKLPEWIQHYQMYELQKQRLGLEAARELRPQTLIGGSGEYVIQVQPNGKMDFKTIDQISGGNFVTTRQAQDAEKRLQDEFKQDITATGMPYSQWRNMPQQKLQYGLLTGAVKPDQYGDLLAATLKDQQRVEDNAKKDTFEIWKKSHKWTTPDPKKFDEWIQKPEGKAVLRTQLDRREKLNKSYSTTLLPQSPADMNPAPAVQGGKPSLEDIFNLGK